LIAPEQADALAGEIERLEAEHGVGEGRTTFQGKRSRRVHNLVGRSELFRRLVLHPTVLELVEALLGPDPLLTIAVSLNLGPGQDKQVLHADDGIYPVTRPHAAMDIQALWALTDFTELNGATHLVPGSHHRDRMPRPDEQVETIRAVMPKGSVVVYHGSVWHCGGANRSRDERRIGAALQYCAGYLRPQENYFLMIPPEEVAAYPERLQKLLGYRLYKGLLGHIDERDPTVALGAEVEPRLIYDEIDDALDSSSAD
jgi:ectoine hydroxylase-related dioxygenase (phytanoyl-CoA dioxygenase family)